MKVISVKIGYNKTKTCYAIVDKDGIITSYGVINDLTEFYETIVNEGITTIIIEDQYFTNENKDTAKVLCRLAGNYEAVAILLGRKIRFIPPSLWKQGLDKQVQKETLASILVGTVVRELNLASAILIADYMGNIK